MNKGIAFVLSSLATMAMIASAAVPVSAASPSAVSSQSPAVQWQASPQATYALDLAPGQSKTFTDAYVTPSGRHISIVLAATRLTEQAAQELLRSGGMPQNEYDQVAAGDPTYSFNFQYSDTFLGIGYGISDNTVWSTDCKSSISVGSQNPADWAAWPYSIGSASPTLSYPTTGEALWGASTTVQALSVLGASLGSGTLSITMQSYANVQGIVMYPLDPFNSTSPVEYTSLGC